MSKIYVGDVGTVILINMGEDISAATTANLIVRKPGDDTDYTWTGSVYNDDYLKYTTLSGNLSVEGEYKLQPSIVLPTWSGKGETVIIRVYDEFE